MEKHQYKHIRILGVDYEVKEVEIINDDPFLCGLCRYDTNEILIKRSISEDNKKIILIHEVIHAILGNLGFENENENENLINSLSSVLYQILKDNDLLLRTRT